MNYPRRIRNKVSKEKKEFAKQLRKNMTTAEKYLWSKRFLINSKMRRQAVVLGYIVDFYLPKKFLAIEIDGSIHNEQIEEDKKRDQILFDKRQIVTIRFTNDEIFSNINKVIDTINASIKFMEESR